MTVAIILTATSGIGQPAGYLTSAPAWIGDCSWFGSMVFWLLLIVSGAWWLVLRMRRHDLPVAR